MNAPLWFYNLLMWSAQVAVLILAAAILLRLLRILHPRVLLVHWRVLLGVSLLLPFLESWRRPQSIPAISIPFSGPFPSVALAPAAASSHSQLFSIPFLVQVVAVVILFGIAFRLVALALGLVKLRQLHCAAAQIPANSDSAPILERAKSLIAAHADFRVSTQVDSPVTFGFTATIVLLPERFFQLSSPSQSAIACHELLHVRRSDWTHHLAEEFLRALFWFHPAILWLVARIRLAREQLVDLEVVRLTHARRPYLDALLEFTSGQRRIAVIPAPPFLAERQLVDRISLLVKEVRMSRTRLMASLSAAVFCLAACAVLAISVFPLKAAPRPLNSPLAQVAASPASNPVVEATSIRTDMVKLGDMPIQVRAFAKLVSPNASGNSVVRARMPESLMTGIRLGQNALVDTHQEILGARVSRIAGEGEAGTRAVDVTLDSPLPNGVDSAATFEVMIQVGELNDVVFVGRPAIVSANSGGWVRAHIFKVVEDGSAAQRISVVFGRASAADIQVISGLQPGDTVILSDMSPYDKFARLQIKR